MLNPQTKSTDSRILRGGDMGGDAFAQRTANRRRVSACKSEVRYLLGSGRRQSPTMSNLRREDLLYPPLSLGQSLRHGFCGGRAYAPPHNRSVLWDLRVIGPICCVPFRNFAADGPSFTPSISERSRSVGKSRWIAGFKEGLRASKEVTSTSNTRIVT